MADSAGIGVIRIQNQGGGVLGAQQIMVEKEHGFEPETPYVFQVWDIVSQYEAKRQRCKQSAGQGNLFPCPAMVC